MTRKFVKRSIFFVHFRGYFTFECRPLRQHGCFGLSEMFRYSTATEAVYLSLQCVRRYTRVGVAPTRKSLHPTPPKKFRISAVSNAGVGKFALLLHA